MSSFQRNQNIIKREKKKKNKTMWNIHKGNIRNYLLRNHKH